MTRHQRIEAVRTVNDHRVQGVGEPTTEVFDASVLQPTLRRHVTPVELFFKNADARFCQQLLSVLLALALSECATNRAEAASGRRLRRFGSRSASFYLYYL